MTYRIAVAGASGYAGGEILRIALQHPDIEVGNLCAASSAGSYLGDHHRHLSALRERELIATTAENLAAHDAVFMALPHGASAALATELLAQNPDIAILDCGADYRLTSAAAWEEYYGTAHAGTWTYGMPELLHQGEKQATHQRSLIAQSRQIAVPGCNVTAVTLALGPGISTGIVQAADIAAVLAVGYSGAGRAAKVNLLASEALGNAAGYAMAGTHRHIPEIVQNLEVSGASAVKISFTPLLIPVARGILATVSVPYTGDGSTFRQAWEAAYGGEKVIRLLPRGQWPQLSSVAATGLAEVQVELDEKAGRLVIQCAIDNLGKGTAGAAWQSFNLVHDLPETTGITLIGGAP